LLRQPLATTGALPIGALPAQPAALNSARMAVVAIKNFFIGAPIDPKNRVTRKLQRVAILAQWQVVI
jgi:hypothetical protein